MKTRKYIIFMVVILGVLLSAMLASCDTTPQTSGDENTQTQALQESDAATQNEIDETQMETTLETEIETELQTEIFQETNVETEKETDEATTAQLTVEIPYSQRILYVGLTSKEIADRNMRVPKNLNIQPVKIFEALQEVKKEDVGDKQIQQGDQTYQVSYQYTRTTGVSTRITDKFINYDVYSTADGRETYIFNADGMLKRYRSTGRGRGESLEAVSEDEAIKIARQFLTTWYADAINFEEYVFRVIVFTPSDQSSPPITDVYVVKPLGKKYGVSDRCQITINSDGKIIEVDAENLGARSYFSDITDAQYQSAEEFLMYAASACGRTPNESTLHLTIGHDGKLYMCIEALGWTYNDDGMLDENSMQVVESFYTCVNP